MLITRVSRLLRMPPTIFTSRECTGLEGQQCEQCNRCGDIWDVTTCPGSHVRVHCIRLYLFGMGVPLKAGSRLKTAGIDSRFL